MNPILEKLYERSPALLQNAAISLYGLKLYRREYGARFFRLLRQFEQRQYHTSDQLLDYQNELLSRLVKHSYEYVPYYRNVMTQRGLRPADIQTVDDLPKLPLLTPDIVRTRAHELIADNAERRQLILGHTSGTTGSPLEFYYDDNTCLVKNVVDWRQKSIAGIAPFDRVALFLGRVIVPLSRTNPPYWRFNWTLKQMFLSSFHLSADTIGLYLDALRQYQPRAIEGYPSTLYIVAKSLLARGEFLPVSAAFTSSETLYPHQREAIEKAFACKLFDFYGLAERVAFATECERHEGHHINLDYGITEIVGADNKPAANGQLGRLVATGLHNYAMPLIRYRTSDVTALREAPCSCGRSFPLMDDVTTKAEDIITTTDGRYISSSILTHPFKPMHTIEESQLVQEGPGELIVRIVPRSDYSQSDSATLVAELKKRLGDDMDIQVQMVEKIERTRAGKFRWVISKVPLEF